jgi:hypothetical protein
MDTTDMSFDAFHARDRFPSVPASTFGEFIERDYVENDRHDRGAPPRFDSVPPTEPNLG